MARDVIHEVVKTALVKDGWKIVADPFRIEYEEFSLLADLEIERMVAIEREGKRLVIEIKSFIGRSFIKEMQQALGQYTMYQDFITLKKPDHDLYLAVSELVYNQFFTQKATQFLTKRHNIHIVIVNTEREEVTQWIPSPNIKTS